MSLFQLCVKMALDKAACKELDGLIEQLNECRQLSEPHVKSLCDKVSTLDVVKLSLWNM